MSDLVCFKCDLICKNKSNLKVHVLSHFYDCFYKLLPDSKPYECPNCQHKHRDRISLVRHYAFTHRKIFDFVTKDQLGIKTKASTMQPRTPETTMATELEIFSIDKLLDTCSGCSEDEGTVVVSGNEKTIDFTEEKALKQSLLEIVRDAGDEGPQVGDFVAKFSITPDTISDLIVPKLLEPTDDRTIAKGLAIDLYVAAIIKANLSCRQLVNYFLCLVPTSCHPAVVDDGMVEEVIKKIKRVKVTAQKFRNAYTLHYSYPQFLDKYLLEQFDPFS